MERFCPPPSARNNTSSITFGCLPMQTPPTPTPIHAPCSVMDERSCCSPGDAAPGRTMFGLLLALSPDTASCAEPGCGLTLPYMPLGEGLLPLLLLGLPEGSRPGSGGTGTKNSSSGSDGGLLRCRSQGFRTSGSTTPGAPWDHINPRTNTACVVLEIVWSDLRTRSALF
jgi:hypothetical protein